MRRGLWIMVPALLLTTVACGRHQGEDDDLPGTTPAMSPVTVEVTNNFALPVEVVAVGSNITQRLGTVHPGMVGRFVIPPNMIGNGSVELEARASSTVQVARSGPMLLAPGAIVDFQIGAQLFNSTASIRH